MKPEHFIALSGSVGDGTTGAVVDAAASEVETNGVQADICNTKIGAGVVGAVAGAITAEVLAGAPPP